MTPDVNVLVAASRADHPYHLPASAWVKEAVTRESFSLLPMVATSFVRVVTNAKIFPRPTPTATALKFVNVLLDATERPLLSLSAEWHFFCDLVDDQSVKANLVSDAWIAASVVQHNEHLVTFDKDFRKLLPRSRLTVLKPQSR